MKRRDFISHSLTAVAASGVTFAAIKAFSDAPTGVSEGTSNVLNSDKKLIAMLVYPDFTALDLIAPQTLFSTMLGHQTHLVWKNREPVVSDTNVTFIPTMTLAECPPDVDILFVPGGTRGTVNMMTDGEILDFLATRGENASFITSVCTGALVLGAAGLLRGYKATTHWVAHELLPLFGAEPVNERVVEDGNRITGAGVTAGLDFGLRIVSKIQGEEYAHAVQLAQEYDPQPPFNSGTPNTAPSKSVEFVQQIFTPFVESAREAGQNLK